MMSATVVKGRTLTYVTIRGIHPHDRETLVDYAIEQAGETRSSLFGWDVRFLPFEEDAAVVSLYTD